MSKYSTLLLSMFVFSSLGLAETFAREIAPPVIEIPEGTFVQGSDRNEREKAYQLDEKAYGHSVTRKNRWYEGEKKRQTVRLDCFQISETPITNAQYAEFIKETGHRVPDVDVETWNSYRLIHPFSRSRRHAWINGEIPPNRENHPVVMVSHSDAEAYAEWLSKKTKQKWSLPNETQWEKAARGADGRTFPWGNDYKANVLNSHDDGPFDTSPVGMFPDGASPFGLLDAAGQVFEWTATPARNNRWIVKGGSWDDKGCGVCRPAARHTRPESIKHILVGFRVVRNQCDLK